jgi:hypothetical protein
VSHWFDAQAARSRRLKPEQRRRIRLIKQELAKSNGELHRCWHEILKEEDSAVRFGPQASYGGRLFSDVSVRFRAQLGAELLRARDRLAALHTGLQAEHELRQALTAAAAGADAWYHALSTDDARKISDAEKAMSRHFADADRLHRAGLANLEKGR